MGSLVIAYNVPGKRPLTVAVVDDPHLLQEVACAAIAQAEKKVALAAQSDPMMGRLQAAEISRLRSVLGLLVPGLHSLTPPVN